MIQHSATNSSAYARRIVSANHPANRRCEVRERRAHDYPLDRVDHETGMDELVKSRDRGVDHVSHQTERGEPADISPRLLVQCRVGWIFAFIFRFSKLSCSF